VRWLNDQTSGGLRVRGFDIRRDSRVIPGTLWTPEHAEVPTPLVLIGHGATGHKGTEYVADLAKALVRRGVAAAAIDGPVHGDRRADGGRNPQLTFLDFGQAWSSDPTMTDEMVADWVAALDALLELSELSSVGVGWWGVSMGTIIGLPLVAAESRIRAAVLGLMGLTGPTQARIGRDAPNVRCSVLFLVQWDDELFSRQSAMDLFEAIGSEDKRMYAHPGSHGAIPAEAFRLSGTFLVERLADQPLP
jgi:dienelactone hydrolase